MVLPPTEIWVTEERAGLGVGEKEIENELHFRHVELRYLWDIQVEMSSRQVEIRAWSSGKRSGLEI